MPWFKIDDSAHNHPKWRRAGNAAIGLWTRCGSYAANHLTEGIISGAVARDYGTPVQISRLVKVGLWHEPGHSCPRCPQPADDEYVMHDYFENGRNTSKAQAEADREAAAERQRRRRERQREAQAAEKPASNRSRIGAESEPNRPPVSQDSAGQSHVSRRESHDPCQAKPSVPPTEVQRQEESRPERAPSHEGATAIAFTGPASMPIESQATSIERAPSRSGSTETHHGSAEIPDWAMPLVRQIQATLPGLRWNLASADWLIVDALIRAKGIDAMTDFATRAAGSSPRPVSSARYFLRGWRELPGAPPDGSSPPQLRAVNGTPPPESTGTKRARAALEAGLRVQAMADRGELPR